jgi:DNA-directed RNA polymerase subunit RPC12/RpoP
MEAFVIYYRVFACMGIEADSVEAAREKWDDVINDIVIRGIGDDDPIIDFDHIEDEMGDVVMGAPTEPSDETDNFRCLDCGMDTSSANPGNYYLLHNVLWEEITTLQEQDAMLCVSCASKRLGRPLVAEDFAVTPVAMVRWFLSMLTKD